MGLGMEEADREVVLRARSTSTRKGRSMPTAPTISILIRPTRIRSGGRCCA
jgi:hypothetical protein